MILLIVNTKGTFGSNFQQMLLHNPCNWYKPKFLCSKESQPLGVHIPWTVPWECYMKTSGEDLFSVKQNCLRNRIYIRNFLVLFFVKIYTSLISFPPPSRHSDTHPDCCLYIPDCKSSRKCKKKTVCWDASIKLATKHEKLYLHQIAWLRKINKMSFFPQFDSKWVFF